MRPIEKIILRIKSIDAIALRVIIACLLLSCVLTLLFGGNITSRNEIAFIFIWYSLIFGLWICLGSIIFIVLSIIIYAHKRIGTWRTFKTEIILTLAGIASLVLVWLCGLVVY